MIDKYEVLAIHKQNKREMHVTVNALCPADALVQAKKAMFNPMAWTFVDAVKIVERIRCE